MHACYLDHTQPNKKNQKIKVGIQDLLSLMTEVIDAHSHGVYKGMKYVEHLPVVIPVEVSGQLRETYIVSWVRIFIHCMSFS